MYYNMVTAQGRKVLECFLALTRVFSDAVKMCSHAKLGLLTRNARRAMRRIQIDRLALAGVLMLAPVYAQTVVTISPTAASVHLGTYYQFSGKVTGATSTAVAWSVALPAGATGSTGTISTG